MPGRERRHRGLYPLLRGLVIAFQLLQLVILVGKRLHILACRIDLLFVPVFFFLIVGHFVFQIAQFALGRLDILFAAAVIIFRLAQGLFQLADLGLNGRLPVDQGLQGIHFGLGGVHGVHSGL